MSDWKNEILLKINREDDRLTAAAILIKNGYRVAQRKEKSATGKSYIYYLEVGTNG